MKALKYPLFAALAALALPAVWLRPGQKAAPAAKVDVEKGVVLAIHGGAGVLPSEKMTRELDKAYRADLKAALDAGHKALQKKGGTSLDAVAAAIVVLEDSPRYNAGKGAVFTNDGRNELDASIMEGKQRRAGAVAGVCVLKNPILAARAVMEKSEHVLLVGRGAELFASKQGLEVVDPSYFFTKERWTQLQDAQKREKEKKESRGPAAGRYLGTVGAVAVDGAGDLAAGTSTGGMTNKRFNRVGDSPIIGAGTYADNASCAVSCTGWGEVFIRHAVAHDVSARMKYGKASVREAAEQTLRALPQEEGGVGGFIALDAKGNLAMAYDTEGMYRGHVTADGTVRVFIYGK